jgi:hypothetical protein
MTKFGAANVVISTSGPSPPTITSISPNQGAPGDALQITGSNLGQMVVFSGPNGLPILTPINEGSSTLLNVQVPLDVVTGPVFVQSGVGIAISKSNAMPFGRVPDLRIRATQRDLGPNESTTIKTVFFGSTGAEPIVWSVDQGTISPDGTYTAPASVPSDTFAHISACIQGTQICDPLLLGLHPFRISPAAPVAALGQELQMQTLASDLPVSATWSQLTGGGNLLSDGAYTASSSPADGGSTLISAAYQGSTEQSSIGVTGGFPGIVNRVNDYLDFTNVQIQRVTQTMSVAVATNRMYVLSAQKDGGALDPKLFYIDVYDISDPVNPVWINAVEAATAGHLYVFGGILYDVGGIQSQVIAAYDLSGDVPVLVGRQILPPSLGFSFSGGIFTGIENSSQAADAPVLIDEFSLGSGNIVERQISIPPALSGMAYAVSTAVTNQTRLYVTESSTSGDPSSILAAYDITTNSPTLIGTVALEETRSLPFGELLTTTRLYTDQKIFDITQDPPVLLGSMPEPLTVIDADSTRVLGQTTQNGLRLIDTTDPAHPQSMAELLDFGVFQQPAVLSGNYLYSVEGRGGIAIYDISAPGGQIFKAHLGSQNPIPGRFIAVGQTANATTLFAAGFDPVSTQSVLVLDLQQQPPALVGYITSLVPSNDVALAGSTLFVGSEQNLSAFDVSEPSQPEQIASINVPTNSLAISGSVLFAGTTDGHLMVYNISTPSFPIALASVSLSDRPIQLALSGTLLFVADRAGGLLTFNVSTPSNPILLSQLTVLPAVMGVQVDGNLALLAALETGLVIVDVSNPSLPEILSETALDSDDPFDVGRSDFQDRAAVIAVQNQVAFIGVNNFSPESEESNGGGGIYGFDYRQPQHPRLVSSSMQAAAADGEITSLFIVGSNLFVSGDNVGLIQLDITNPRNTINLYYPPESLRMPYPPAPPIPAISATGLRAQNKWKSRTTAILSH